MAENTLEVPTEKTPEELAAEARVSEERNMGVGQENPGEAQNEASEDDTVEKKTEDSVDVEPSEEEEEAVVIDETPVQPENEDPAFNCEPCKGSGLVISRVCTECNGTGKV